MSVWLIFSFFPIFSLQLETMNVRGRSRLSEDAEKIDLAECLMVRTHREVEIVVRRLRSRGRICWRTSESARWERGLCGTVR